MSVACVVCDSSTKYKFIKCKAPICNNLLHCSIPVSEDFPTAFQHISLCKQSGKNIEQTMKDNDVVIVVKYGKEK